MKDKEARKEIEELKEKIEKLEREIKSQIYMERTHHIDYTSCNTYYEYELPIKEVIEKLLDHLNLWCKYHYQKPSRYTLEEKSKE